jgi:hypothetical protein
MITLIFSEQLVPIDDQTSQDIFLLLDEVPCNSDPGFNNFFYGRPSGDWKDLKRNGVNLMMVLKPIGQSGFKGHVSCLLDKIKSRKSAINFCFPTDIAHLQLSRIYRCTKNIAEFYKEIVTHMNKSDMRENNGINSSSVLYSPGHEIHGDRPEVLFLPKCNCYSYCNNLVEHLLQENKTKILALLKRIQLKFSVSEITILIDTYQCQQNNQKCVRWLKTELIKENGTIGNLVFKTIEQCRGLEFPVLLTISSALPSNFLNVASTTLDAWTRVTASLFIIQMDDKNSPVIQGLKDCLKKQVAKQAEEQEEIKYNLLKKLYIFFQSAFFQVIAGHLLFNFLIFYTYIYICIMKLVTSTQVTAGLFLTVFTIILIVCIIKLVTLFM